MLPRCAGQFSDEEAELHWHDFDSVAYVTGGKITLSRKDGDSIYWQRGAKVAAKEGLIHCKQSTVYSPIIGF